MKVEEIKMNNTDKKDIRIRGWIAVVFSVISAAIILVLFVMALLEHNTFIVSLGTGLMVGLVVGGIIPGFSHFSGILCKIEILLAIPIIGWAIWLYIIIGVPFLFGWIFMIVDLIKFLKLRKEEK